MLVVFGLMVLNGVFAGAEIAVLSVRKTRLSELVDEGLRGAEQVSWLRREPERFLATVQIGITVVGTTAAAFGGERMAGEFGRWLAGHAPWMGSHATEVGLASVVVLISFLEIVVGELVPKSLALRSAEGYALLMGVPLRWMSSLMRPAVWLLTHASNLVLRLFGDQTSFTEARLSPDEIRELVEEAAAVGSIDKKSSEIATRAIDFRELTVGDVMVPRVSIVSVERHAPVDELHERLAARRVSRLPVYEGSPDNVVGYVTLKDMMLPALAGTLDLGALLRPVRFVPSTQLAADLLRDMQTRREPLVMAVDESGGVIGLVTIEDILEELVGDILSEHEPAPTSMTFGADGSVVVPGATPIRDINRALGLELPEPEGFVTIAGLCLHEAQQIPPVGASLTLPDGTRLDIIDVTARRIRNVRLHPPPKPPAETE